MNGPLKAKITNAVKYPQLIKDPFFEGFSPVNKQSGGIQEWGGGFSMVYCLAKNNEKWAFKVWPNEIYGIKERYDEIIPYLKQCNLSYFSSNFSYVEKGLFVSDIFLDTFRMEWVTGLNLTEFISKHLNNKEVLKKLSDDFITMIKKLHECSISHGDLQHRNIYIQDNGQIKLLDYDSICVPALEGQSDFIRGLRAFQHPLRFNKHVKSFASTKVDYFSELIIYISILAVIENPNLWDRYKVPLADDRLLFSEKDFFDWEDSTLRRDLCVLSQEIKDLVKILEKYLSPPHLGLVPFSA